MDHQKAMEKMAELQKQIAELADWLKVPPAVQPTPSSGSCPELSESSASESVTQSVAKLSIASSGSSWEPSWTVEPPCRSLTVHRKQTKARGPKTKEDGGATGIRMMTPGPSGDLGAAEILVLLLLQ